VTALLLGFEIVAFDIVAEEFTHFFGLDYQNGG